jgi:CRISPR-associated endonuclease/helicase Cas3
MLALAASDAVRDAYMAHTPPTSVGVTLVNFDQHFCSLTEAGSPFPWQRRLWGLMANAEFDKCATCVLPTGLGKTSIIPIWLLALAANPTQVPRRLVYVVNRRTVVDQASDEVKRIRERLLAGRAPAVTDSLRTMCGVEYSVPLAISTLRGQFADNAEWRLDPARPAVVVGTVDMIGSRLLFSGYGTGFRSRSVHAGLLGQDTLLIHDEAHLEPAFQRLLEAIESEQSRSGDIRPLRVVELTATSRSGTSCPFTLDRDDEADPTVAKRLTATKRLTLHACEDEKAVVDGMLRTAIAHADSKSAVLVFARRIDAAEKIAAELGKKRYPVALLTGTMRGFERDRLASTDPVFARFLPDSSRPDGVSPVEGAAYLVCTSAGEVGINISADHLVCDLTPFDSMAQRLGRVNRFGAGDASVDVFHPEQLDPKEMLAKQRAATLEALRQLPPTGKALQASPSALASLPADRRLAAFTPSPQVLPATDVLFDAWTLTTIRHELPGRPPVADWLHGVADWQPPDTQIAWREEVQVLGETVSADEIEEVLADYPVKPHEILRDRQHRVFNQLEVLAGHRPDDIAWVMSPSGQITRHTLRSLTEKTASKLPQVALADCLVLLSPCSGGLSPQGTLDGTCVEATDVADRWYDETNRQKRVRVWGDESPPTPGPWRLVRVIDVTDGDADEPPDEVTQRKKFFWRWFVRPRAADDDGSLAGTAAQELDDHLSRAAAVGRRLATNLHLPDDLAEAVVACLRWHDLGKNRRVWQVAIGNTSYAAGRVLAKSGGVMKPALLNSYRHEFGSLLDLAKQKEADLSALQRRDLTLHLIAAHHGRARPHFPAVEVFDPSHPASECDLMAMAVPYRFASVQKQHGRWALAWLEAIARSADAIASQPEGEVL